MITANPLECGACLVLAKDYYLFLGHWVNGK